MPAIVIETSHHEFIVMDSSGNTIKPTSGGLLSAPAFFATRSMAEMVAQCCDVAEEAARKIAAEQHRIFLDRKAEEAKQFAELRANLETEFGVVGNSRAGKLWEIVSDYGRALGSDSYSWEPQEIREYYEILVELIR